MNKFLKLAILPVAFLVSGTTSSCSVSPREIALITDIGDIDDGSFNQESWEAVKEFAVKNHKTYDFYRPFNDSDFARNCAVKQAVAKGAKVIVLPGFKFAPTCAAVMGKYPKVNFLLIDSYIHNGDYNAIDPTPNACCVGFKCEYSGFIAGYAIAQDLMTRDLEKTNKLMDQYGYGYMGGMATSGVYEFGYGFIQGICRATADFCAAHNITTKPNVRVNYAYAGVFAQDDAAAIKVKSWYTGKDGIKVVFPCGGKLYQSVTEAAQYYNKHYVRNYEAWFKGKLDHAPRDGARWVGVDSDQYRGLKYDYELQSIYTSALKGLNPAIINALTLSYNNEWYRIGGTREIGPVAGGGQIDYGSKWVLGLNSVFGEYGENDIDDHRGDYVGIPEVYDEDTKIMRGFDNFKYDDGTEEHKNDFMGLYKKLINEDKDVRIPVSGDDGTSWTNPSGKKITSGYPEDMDKWYKTESGKRIDFRETYLGNYPEDKIVIDVQ